jgi:glycosyl hydrolase family 10
MQILSSRRTWAALAAVLVACAPAAPAGAAVAAPAVSFCTSAVGSTQLLGNPRFDGTFATHAPAWDDNAWGGAKVRMWRDPSHPHGGAAVQAVTVSTLGTGGALFAEPVSLVGGRVYQASVWLRSPDHATVDFELRHSNAWYEAGADQRITLTPTWRRYVIRGGFATDTPTQFMIGFDTTGTVEIDDASLRSVSRPGCAATTAPIPATYFGMHINKWGTFTRWPSELGFGLVRLWDTGTRWSNLEPAPGSWHWSRMDYYVNAAVAAHEQVLYTLGMPPQWASSAPNDPKSGADAPPASLADWRAYVRAVATRYKGRVHDWEIWNEVNGSFYTGSATELVRLTQAAAQELRAVDPTNVVLSPDFTRSGLPFLSEFLADGGGRYVNAVSVHAYQGQTPEGDAPFFAAVRNIMRRSGLASLPLWNTEGAAGTPTSSDEVAGGLLARSYLVEWLWGVRSVDWYAWDISVGSPLSQPDHVTPTAAGLAYERVVAWLEGSRMLGSTHAADGTWTVTLERPGGSLAYAVWNTRGAATYAVPAGDAVAHVQTLSGASGPISGSAVPIGVAPVLLTP